MQNVEIVFVAIGFPLMLLLLNWVFVKGQLVMKAKIARQIDWGIENGRIKLEIDGKSKSSNELYAVICAKDYPQK